MAAILKKLAAPVSPLVYYTRVGWETAKLVWTREKMGPPTMAEWPMAQRQLQQMLGNLNTAHLLNMTVREALTKSIVGFQIITFFFVGEIIGRRSLIGYNVKVPSDSSHGHK